MGTNTGLISGRVKKVPATNADPNRYNWLNLQNAEPDLGVPTSNGSFFTSDTNGNRSWSNSLTVVSNTVTMTNVVLTGTANLGPVGNITITGGSPNYVLSTDGAGNLSWAAQTGGGGTPGGFNTYVQFNDAGSFGGSGKFLFNKITNTLSTGNIVTVGSNVGINFQTTPGNTVSFLAPLTANNASFYVPESAGALQQVLTITSNSSVQGLGWKTLPANYIDVTMRDNSTLTVNPTIVLRKYPVRLRSGTIINVATV
jgi:hypothetical protein